MKPNIKTLLKKLPTEISITGLALLLVTIERGSLLAETILEGNKGRPELKKSLRKIESAKSFYDFYNEIKNNRIRADSARTILWRLRQKGLVKKDGRKFIATPKGKMIAKIFKRKARGPQKWDKKWRMVFFDIPELKRKQREWIYYNLLSAEYRPLQKSVFIGKLPLDEKLMKEIIDRELYQYIRIITVGEIDDEKFFV